MKVTTEQQVHLFHILFVGSLFLYVGISKDRIPFDPWFDCYHLSSLQSNCKKNETNMGVINSYYSCWSFVALYRV